MTAEGRVRGQSRGRKLIALIGIAAVGLWLVLVAGLAVAMRQPPATFGKVMSHTPMPLFLVLPFKTLWMNARAGSLHEGDTAPDFTLPTVDRKDSVRLAQHRGIRPVVLIFGSYT